MYYYPHKIDSSTDIQQTQMTSVNVYGTGSSVTIDGETFTAYFVQSGVFDITAPKKGMIVEQYGVNGIVVAYQLAANTRTRLRTTQPIVTFIPT